MGTRVLWLVALTVGVIAVGCGDSSRRGSSSDSGIRLDGGPTETSCGTDVVDRVSDAYCSEATASCIEACEPGECLADCLDSDPNPDCSACVNINIVSCANANGCQSSWDDYTCCLDEQCPADAGTSCVDEAIAGPCGGDSDRYDECVGTVDLATDCPNVLSDCF